MIALSGRGFFSLSSTIINVWRGKRRGRGGEEVIVVFSFLPCNILRPPFRTNSDKITGNGRKAFFFESPEQSVVVVNFLPRIIIRIGVCSALYRFRETDSQPPAKCIDRVFFFFFSREAFYGEYIGYDRVVCMCAIVALVPLRMPPCLLAFSM